MTEVIEDIVPPISNSEIQVFMRCRRKWYLEHVRELGLRANQVPLAGALAFGSRIHECLERLYETGEDPLEIYEELHSKVVYDLLVREQAVGYVDKDTRKKVQAERELGHAMLSGFVEWSQETGLDEGLKLIGAEVVIEVASGIPGVRLRGKLDQRIEREVDHARLFRDFKTAADLIHGPRMLPMDEQMKMYMLLERLDALAKNGEEPSEPTIGGLYTMLKKVKRTERATPPFYAQVEVHHNRLELESMMLRTQRRITEMLEARQQMEAGGDQRYWVYPRPSRDCTWDCPFVAVCPAMDDSRPEVWEAMLGDLYEKRDPYARYAADETKG